MTAYRVVASGLLAGLPASGTGQPPFYYATDDGAEGQLYYWTGSAWVVFTPGIASLISALAAIEGDYYVDDYGAHHDAKTNATIKTTAGSNIITATDSPFASGDTGKLAWIPGAGTDAQHLIGYLSYTDANHCNLLQTPGGAAQNAVTTLITAGQMVWGQDDAAAIAAAEAARVAAGNGNLVYGPHSYITSGTLADTTALYQRGSTRSQSKVYCTADYYWKSDQTTTTRIWVRDIGFFFKKHGFADTRVQANSSGLPARTFDRCEFQWYTGCCFQTNTSDGPGYHFNECTSTGWDELRTIGFILSGQADSSTFNACQFTGAHRVIIRYTRGNNATIHGSTGLISALPPNICTTSGGAMTAGSTTLTVSGGLDSSHVGLTVAVPKATDLPGANNTGQLNSVIKSVTNATTCELMDPATATTSGQTITLKAKGSPYRTVFDAAVTAGTKTITSATANFTSADVGCGVNLAAAGWPGPSDSSLSARIQQVTNSTTIIINVAATTTVSGQQLKINRPQAKLQVEPYTGLATNSNGLSLHDVKFGSEKILPGDIHIGFMDSEVELVATDGAMTAGSATLTSATSGFTPGMAQTRYVVVIGAGTNSTNIYSKIETYISPTQVTLTTAAGTTITGTTVTRTQIEGERMPVIDTPSTGYIVQPSVIDCNLGNAGSGANGVTLAPYFSMTPNTRGGIYGPGIEYGSGFLWHMEYGPGVTATADAYNASNLVYPLLDDNSGRTRLAPAISSIPGMFAKELSDPGQVSGTRSVHYENVGGGLSAGVAHILKTRARSFTVNATAHKVSDLTHPELGADSAEYSMDTSAGIVSATLLQADIPVGVPCILAMVLGTGTTNPLDRIRVRINYSGGATFFQEYVDIPPSGSIPVRFRVMFPEVSANVLLRFETDIAGQWQLTKPVLYKSRGQVDWGPKRFFSPNGTTYLADATDIGWISGVYAAPLNGSSAFSASTTTTVTHGLGTTPSRVIISPTSSPAGLTYFVSAKGATTFTVTASASTSMTFDWIAIP